MTSLAVVAYPALAEDDRRWIEGVRARHDPLALRVAAHFTLVFPTEVAEAPVPAQVEALSDGVLATHRRRDIPFIPHVTVGRHDDLGECERIANRLSVARPPAADCDR